MDLFNQYLKKTGEYGIVHQVSHPIVFLEGLPKVKTHEIIYFEGGQKAEVFAITRGKIEARVFSHEPIKVGTKATRTDELLSVPVGPELLGHVINPLGEPLDPTQPYTRPKELRDLESKPIGISGRQKLTRSLATGVALIDLLIPLGLGQRELIIGDRKTGKTSLLLTAMKSQVENGVVAIYCAIAKKKSDIKRIQEFFIQQGIADKVIIVATSSYDSPSLIYQTPYAGMSIAEYFRDLGQPTLLVLDDLSTHAKFYRELSLLARRFPGRDSYPGDVFYVHSRLLERAGNFKHKEKGEVSITCLPVIEIVEGDFTGYISTNVMGITDGHIYLDSNIYYQGMRPAVNIPLSVTRVGRQTLDKLSREVNKELSAFLAQYDKLQNLSHFGQELTDDVKKQLRMGEIIYKFFQQPYQETVPTTIQLIIISMILQDIIPDKETLDRVKKSLINAFYHDEPKQWLMEVAVAKNLKTFNENVLKNKEHLLTLKLTPEQEAAGKQKAQAQAQIQTQPEQTPPSPQKPIQTQQPLPQPPPTPPMAPVAPTSIQQQQTQPVTQPQPSPSPASPQQSAQQQPAGTQTQAPADSNKQKRFFVKKK
ncbi:MAG TPA: F0F1 ATP synthase subunit alpha [Patescibacteria group bacterium]|nr:F0F1 ATP synthase subunit alpha [Patescibacteria group bacterium]